MPRYRATVEIEIYSPICETDPQCTMTQQDVIQALELVQSYALCVRGAPEKYTSSVSIKRIVPNQTCKHCGSDALILKIAD